MVFMRLLIVLSQQAKKPPAPGHPSSAKTAQSAQHSKPMERSVVQQIRSGDRLRRMGLLERILMRMAQLEGGCKRHWANKWRHETRPSDWIKYRKEVTRESKRRKA